MGIEPRTRDWNTFAQTTATKPRQPQTYAFITSLCQSCDLKHSTDHSQKTYSVLSGFFMSWALVSLKLAAWDYLTLQYSCFRLRSWDINLIYSYWDKKYIRISGKRDSLKIALCFSVVIYRGCIVVNGSGLFVRVLFW